MTKPEKGMEYVDVHRMWKDEALNFTPWLADNLQELNKVLGVELELDQTEKPVGPFYCDILAKVAGSDAKVAIENQLELANHSHLGQLLTYAAGLEAQIAVWVAPEILYEHAAALHWLNTWTSGPRFYGVKVMVLKNGNTLEPRFYPVVTPDEWNKEITLPTKAVDPHKLQFDAFFWPLVTELLRAHFAAKALNQFNYTGRRFPSERNPGIWYAASLEGNNDAWVTLHISTADKDLTKLVFDELSRDKEIVEASISLAPGQEWHWRRYPNYLFSSISIRRDGCIDDPLEKLEETRAWMLKMLPLFKKVFDPRVESILTKLQGNGDG